MEDAQIEAMLRAAQAAYVAEMPAIKAAKSALEKTRQDAVKVATEAGWRAPRIRKALEEGGGQPVSRQTVAFIRNAVTDREDTP